MTLKVRMKTRTMRDRRDGQGQLLVTLQTQLHLSPAIVYMAISEQQLGIVRQINGKCKVHQILRVIKTAYNWIPSLSSSWMWDQTICEPSSLLSTSDRQRTFHGAETYCSTLVFKEVVRPMHCAVLLIQWRPKSRRWGTGCLRSCFKKLKFCYKRFRNESWLLVSSL